MLKTINIALLFVLSLSLVSCASLKTSSVETGTTSIKKGDIDQREYQLITLENRLQVLLISDPQADKAAAALDVFVGSGADPEGREGLAHFLEHMLFLGTEKYPEAGEYQAFVASHGGRHNAYTSFEHTNYIFDVDAEYLPATLDRFAQFFIAPLFSEHYVEREKNAVNSEYSARSKSEFRRSLDALKQVTNPQHPFSKFSVGSLSTLSNGETKTRDELLKFYQQHYSANVMSLVIMGRESLPELKKMAQDKFATIVDRDVQLEEITEPLFSENTLPARLSIVPEKDLRQLSLSFPIPDMREFYRSKPLSYISNIIGHEGKGSLLSALKRRGWAESVSAGGGISYLGGATFDVSIALTEKGLQHSNDVAVMVFQSINRVRENGVQRWLFDELGNISDIQFRFREQGEPFHYVSSLANSMQYYDAVDLLSGPYLMTDYDADLFQYLLTYLQPKNALLKVVAKGVPVDQQSPWYHTDYSFEPLAEQTLQQWMRAGVNDEIVLPQENPFIPESLKVQSRQQMEKPLLLESEENYRLWFYQDDLFSVPKSGLFFSVRSPLASDQAKHAVLAQMYVMMLNDHLNEFVYPAQLAGLQFSLSKHTRGFSVRISGYSEKQTLLLARIVERLAKVDFDPERFESLKQELQRRLGNSERAEPYRLLLRDIRDFIYQPHWNEQERSAALAPLQFSDLKLYIDQFWQQVSIEALVNGNSSNEEAKRSFELIRSLLPSGPSEPLPALEVVSLPAGEGYSSRRSVIHPDASYLLYLQGEDNSYASQAAVALTAQIIESPFYEQIRTEQQMGYIVWASYMPLLTVPGLAFVVQSPAHSEADIAYSVDSFIDHFESEALNAESFEQHKRALIHQLLEKPRNLYEQTEELWLAIALSDRKFERKARVAEEVEKISLQQWRTIYNKMLLSDERREFVLQTDKAKQANTGHKVITDPKRFKQQQQFYSYP